MIPNKGAVPDEEINSDVLQHADFKILVVDDEDSVRGFVRAFLERQEYPVVEAANGNEGLDRVTAEKPSLIITDFRMPEKGGVDMVSDMKLRGFDIPVIFMTGYTEYEDLATAITLQPIGFLQKPFEMKQFLSLVKKAFETKRNEIIHEEYKESLKRGIEAKSRQLEFRTERLEVERKILTGIVGQANFGLLALDTGSRIHIVNKLAVEMLQIPADRAGWAVGAPLSDIVPSTFSDFLSEKYTIVIESEEVVDEDFWVEELQQKLNIVTYGIWHNGLISGVVFIIHDITEKDSLQKKLLQTAKLASIGELAAGVAHEINNPLGFVNSNCNTLKEYFTSMVEYMNSFENCSKQAASNGGEGKSPGTCMAELRKQHDIEFIVEDGCTMIDETLEGLARVSKIVLDLKSFARVDNNEMESADVNKLIEDALNLVRNETKYKLDITKNLGELPPVECVPNQLVQVLTNLFINASQAVKEHGNLTVSSQVENRLVVLKVADDGDGIPPHIVSRIFDPFFTTKAPGKGTGMGLSISYGIIERHNGTISVESEEGRGTTFTIELPFKPDNKEKNQNSPSEETDVAVK